MADKNVIKYKLNKETEMDVNLSLNVDEVNFLLQILGELPTKTGAWNLVQKVKQQAETQFPPPVQTAQAK